MKYDYLVGDHIIEIDQKISDPPLTTVAEIKAHFADIFQISAATVGIPDDTPVTRLISSGTGVLWNCSRSTL